MSIIMYITCTHHNDATVMNMEQHRSDKGTKLTFSNIEFFCRAVLKNYQTVNIYQI